MKRVFVASAMFVLLLAGCATESGEPAAPAPQSAGAAGSPVPARAEGLLGRHGLAGKGTVQIIDELDRLAVKDRPADLTASVRPDHVVVSDGTQQVKLAIPDGRFYLSVAPYLSRTHTCFYHSLTTCRGELAGREIGVKIVDETDGTVLVDETRTTFDNGFLGFWLPRGFEGSVRMTYDGRTGETKISTGEDAPTCLTTLQLT